jgi:hypothetical protein
MDAGSKRKAGWVAVLSGADERLALWLALVASAVLLTTLVALLKPGPSLWPLWAGLGAWAIALAAALPVLSRWRLRSGAGERRERAPTSWPPASGLPEAMMVESPPSVPPPAPLRLARRATARASSAPPPPPPGSTRKPLSQRIGPAAESRLAPPAPAPPPRAWQGEAPPPRSYYLPGNGAARES